MSFLRTAPPCSLFFSPGQCTTWAESIKDGGEGSTAKPNEKKRKEYKKQI